MPLSFRPRSSASVNLYMADASQPDVHIFRDDNDPNEVDFVTIKSNGHDLGSEVTLFFQTIEQANQWVTDLVADFDRAITQFHTRTQEVHHEGS